MKESGFFRYHKRRNVLRSGDLKKFLANKMVLMENWRSVGQMITRHFSLKGILLGHNKGSEVGFAVAYSQLFPDAVALEIDRTLGRVKYPGNVLG